jgi:hypothetical protein
MVKFALLTATAFCAARMVSAQCMPPHDSHEARLLAFYSVPIVFSADPATIGLPSGAVRLSGEGVFVPTPSAALQETKYCYAGKPEHTSLTPFFGRPRLAIGLPHGFGVEVSYLPPITIADATPNLAWAALWFSHAMSDNIDVTMRAHLTSGVVHGPITCPHNALQQQDSTAPCYGTTESRDEFRPDMYGGELMASMSPGGRASRVQVSAGVGVNALRPRFQVGFTNSLGVTDHTAILVNLTRVTGFAAATVRLSARCDVSTQGYASFGDVATLRGMVGCRLIR